MGGHDYHDSLPGYDSAQVLVDGCAECEVRAQEPARGISAMDESTFGRMCARALAYERGEIRASACELALFRVLGPALTRLEQRGALLR